jgi:hypothetical protein
VAAPTYTYSGNVYSTSVAGTVDFPLISTAGNAIQYLEASHVHVYSSANNGSSWAELIRPAQWNFVSGGTAVRLASGIATGTWIKVKRITPIAGPYVTFQASSLLTAEQLNDESRSNSYVNQETLDDADLAADDAAGAVSSAAAATATANAATATANGAVVTANAASAQSASAAANATTALSQSGTSLSQSSTALSNSSTALANSSTALANSSAAVTTATNADAKADSAIVAISTSAVFAPVANVAAIPASPTGGQAVQVTNSTGIQSFTPLSGLPAGFIGDAGLTVRILYNSGTSSWVWYGYFAAESDSRYLKLSGGTLTGPLTLAGAPTTNLHPATKAYVDGYINAINGDIASLGSTKLDVTTAASTYQPLAGMSSYLTAATASSTYQTQAGMSGYLATGAIGTTVQGYNANNAVTNVAQNFTAAQRGSYVTLTDAATVAIDLSLGNHFQVTLGGNRAIGAPTNVVAGQSGVIRLVQDATGSRTASWNSVFKFPGGTAPTLTTAANSVDLVAYHCESATRIAARFIGDVK